MVPELELIRLQSHLLCGEYSGVVSAAYVLAVFITHPFLQCGQRLP